MTLVSTVTIFILVVMLVCAGVWIIDYPIREVLFVPATVVKAASHSITTITSKRGVFTILSDSLDEVSTIRLEDGTVTQAKGPYSSDTGHCLTGQIGTNHHETPSDTVFR